MRPTPWWLFPACLAACLCSPYHVFGFSLPADLYPLPFAGGLLQDPRFRLLWASPWQFDAALRSPAGANIAGLAYFVLVALGVASFAVNRSGLRDWRILVWVVFALLGGWSVRLIPFFAVVGGPIAALNWQGMTWELRPTVLKWLRAACVAFLLAVIALALPGWLHGFNQKNMQVAWGVEINPSLRRAAETLYRWRQDGRLGEAERSFCLHPDAACYCAWFGPKDHPEKFRGEKSFVDARFSLFSGAADDYVAVCRGLDPSLAPGVPLARPGPNWREVLSDHHVAVAVLYVPEPGSVLSVLGPLYDNSGDWTLLSIDGQAAIVGWNPARNDYFPQLRFDPGRLAFGPPDEEAPPAPGRGPGRDPYEPGLLSHLGRPAVPAWESAAAQVEMMLFKDPYTPDQRRANDRVYLTSGGGFAGLPGLLAGGGAPAGLSAAVRTVAIQDIRTELLEKPPDLALLAVRAARRAIAADPDDANAYFQLAQAYLALHNETAEHSHSAGYAPLAMLRHVQIVTALRQALILNPDLEAAHQFLADQYLEMRPTPFRDLALEHRSAQLQLARRFGRGATESADAFKQRISQIEAQELSLRNQVQDARELCVIRFKSIGDDPLAKARTALDLGLASTALDDVLMKARVEVYGADVAHQELELLVLTGRSREAKDLLDEEQMRVNKVKLMTYNVAFGGDAGAAYVFPTYEWLLACAGAAVGDYDQAEAALEVTEAFLEARQLAHPAAYAGSVAADVGAPAGGVPGPAALAWLGRRMKQTQALYEEAYHSQQVQRADVLTLTALLDLERGAPDKALRRFQRSIALSRSLLDAGDDVPGAALARELQQRLAAGR
ncbi:MAG TPA: hypothetical protein VMS17_18425 [Gemmataceae bacterium]|nr:hypothetical protein [Gemmataceae bacterium]